MENIMNTIKMLRQKYEYTQEELAKKINVSKATVIAYEKDPSNIPAATVASIAKLFDVDCDCIIHNTQPKSYTYEETGGGSEHPDNNKYPIRIKIPKQNVEKFKEVFLYILGKIGALPHVGQTVLYKILYFIDFDYYELHEKPLIGAKYIKNTYGPTPVDFAKITKKMVEDKELIIVKESYFTREQTKYLPRRKAHLNLLSAEELSHIDKCLLKYADKNARELSAYSHKDVPWLVAKMREPIEYESVFYRTKETSVRNCDHD